MRFSIIIPVYNVERYIRKCLHSVMNQRYDDYEVIIVNDETPDNSMAIVQEFVDEFPNKIRVFNQKNTRQGGARNHGVNYARGEYILFVDSDDYISLDLLKKVDKKLKEEPCDILVFKNILVKEDGSKIEIGGFGDHKEGKYDPNYDKNIISLPVGPVNKAYRREFYLESGFAFPEKVLYEDTVIRCLFAKAKSIVLFDEVLYYYVQSSNSTTRQKPTDKMLDILRVTDMLYTNMSNANLIEKYKEIIDVCSIKTIFYVFDLINQCEPLNPIQNEFASYLMEKYPYYNDIEQLSASYKRRLHLAIQKKFVLYHIRYIILSRVKGNVMKFLSEKTYI